LSHFVTISRSSRFFAKAPNETISNGELNEDVPSNQSDVIGVETRIMDDTTTKVLNDVMRLQNEKTSGGHVVRGFNDDSERRVKLNVGGTSHQTLSGTLRRVPGTRLDLLARQMENDTSYDPESKEFFFDRHSDAFRCVIGYYRTGELHIDNAICGNVIKAVCCTVMTLNYY